MSEFTITTAEALIYLNLKKSAFHQLMKETKTRPVRRGVYIKQQIELAAYKAQRLGVPPK